MNLRFLLPICLAMGCHPPIDYRAYDHLPRHERDAYERCRISLVGAQAVCWDPPSGPEVCEDGRVWYARRETPRDRQSWLLEYYCPPGVAVPDHYLPPVGPPQMTPDPY